MTRKPMTSAKSFATHSIRELLTGSVPLDSNVTIEGWGRTRRDSKAGLSFIQVNDGSCFGNLQVVANNELSNYSSEVLHMTSGSAVRCSGVLVASQGRGQSHEIQATQVSLLGAVENPDSYPIQPKQHSFEFLREVAHLRPRTNTFGAMTRVRHALNLPRNDAGGIDFREDFFGRETFLTVSGQLNVEAFCLAMSKVYTFGPTFRAENSNTSRHLAEFWMVEPEIAFADLNDLVALAEDFLKFVVRQVLERCGDDMAFFAERIEPAAITRLQQIIEQPFQRVSYTDAVQILIKSGKQFEFRPEWGIDLQTEHERFLTEQHFKAPLVVTDYPAAIKAFYMRSNDAAATSDDTVAGDTVAAMDVLAQAMHIDAAHYDWYLDLRRYGTVPHAGFGLGFERLVSYITGMTNIRDVTPYPRVPGNASF
jgi:asparaginyl-tRNA synthetase